MGEWILGKFIVALHSDVGVKLESIILVNKELAAKGSNTTKRRERMWKEPVIQEIIKHW